MESCLTKNSTAHTRSIYDTDEKLKIGLPLKRLLSIIMTHFVPCVIVPWLAEALGLATTSKQ